jgi:hypothetical protein
MADKRVAIELLFAAKGAKEAAGYTRDVGKAVDDLASKLKKADFSAVDTALSKFNRGSYSVDPKVTNGLDAVTKGSEKVGDATKLAAYQSRQLAFQINDVVAQLSTGTPVWRILAQQGGQVTQIYGGVGATFAALLPKIVAFAPAVAAAVAGIAALRGINMGREAAKSITELADNADRAKVSVQSLQKFVAAGAGKGVSSDQIVSGLSAVSTAGLKAADEQKKYYQDLETAQTNVGKGIAGAREELAKLESAKPSDIFTQLGVSMTNFNGRADESIPIIRRVADRLSGMQDGIRKTQFMRLAEETFGAGFAKVLAGGTKAIDEYDKRLDALVPKLSAPEIKAAQANIALSGLLDAAKKRAEDQLGAAFIPAANALDKYLISTFKSNSQAVKSFADEVRAFFEILNGNTEEAARHPALKLIADGYKGLTKLVKGFGSLASEGFSGLANGADKAFDAFNKFFGTDWDAGSTAIKGAIGGIILKFTPLGGILAAMGGSFVALAATVAATALVIYAYSDKIATGIKNFATNALTDAKIRTAQAAAEHARALGDKEAAAKQDQIAADLVKQREQELADQRKKQAEEDKYKGLSAGQEFAARISDALDGASAGVGKFWDKMVSGATGAGTKAGANIAAGIAKGSADGAQAAARELDKVEKAANAAEGRIIKAGNVTSVTIPKDGQQSEPRLIKRASVGMIDEAARYQDKAGNEGWDKVVGTGKIVLDQIEQVSAKKKEIAQPSQINLDSSQAVKANDELKKVDETKRAIEGRIIKGGQVTPTEIPVEQPAAAVAQKTAETASNLGNASVNAGTLTTNVQNAAAQTDTAKAAAKALADEYGRAKDNAAGIKVGASGANNATGGGSGNDSPFPFADGGFVSGAGTSTSDSIPAWLSNGEFVVRASKVAKPGVLGLLRALNGGLNLPSVFGRRRFATGGLVGAVPAGALSAGGQPVHVHFDGVSVGPMTASKGVVDQLLREEAKRRVSSAGRAPSRVG